MSNNTTIEWTERTFNPIRGCRCVSAGCDNCYAKSIASRFSGTDKNGKTMPFTNVAAKVGNESRWTGKVEFDEKILL